MSNNKTPHIGELEAKLEGRGLLSGHSKEVLSSYHRAEARLCYLRLASVNPLTLMGGKLPPHEDAEMNAKTPEGLAECKAKALSYLVSLVSPS